MFRCDVIHVTYNCILKICIRSQNLGYTSRLVIKSEVGRNFRTLYIHHGFSPRGGLTVAGDVVIFVAKEPHLIKNMGSIKSQIYYLLIALDLLEKFSTDSGEVIDAQEKF